MYNHGHYKILYPLLFICLSILSIPVRAERKYQIGIEDVKMDFSNDRLHIYSEIILDSLSLSSNRQLFITPMISDSKGNSDILPSIMVNGRAMHTNYQRKGAKKHYVTDHNILLETCRHNGRSQQIDYHSSVALVPWMWQSEIKLEWLVQPCRCGSNSGAKEEIAYNQMWNLNPASLMRASYVTPPLTSAPIKIHEGETRVLFELGESQLHTLPYLCEDGQRIDNTDALKLIDDSITNALSESNMELVKIKICGYASPEGDYMINNKLSNERTKSLADYLAVRYKLPVEKVEYSSVAENWEGLRQIVSESNEITEDQRHALLALIDAPAYGPADFDGKDNTLRTDPKFSNLYFSTILPKWYPDLRMTKFEISTRLKQASDPELAEIIKTTPDKMSLNQMFRVAGLYPEGSDEFNYVISTALKYYPEDETANLNAASAALKAGDIEVAEKYLEKSGNSPEALNARAILSCYKGDFSNARKIFQEIKNLPEAAKNLEILGK